MECCKLANWIFRNRTHENGFKTICVHRKINIWLIWIATGNQENNNYSIHWKPWKKQIHRCPNLKDLFLFLRRSLEFRGVFHWRVLPSVCYLLCESKHCYFAGAAASLCIANFWLNGLSKIPETQCWYPRRNQYKIQLTLHKLKQWSFDWFLFFLWENPVSAH